MSFQAVEPEDPKERGPKLVAQDRGTSSLFASGTEVRLVSNVQKSGARPCRHVSCMAADTGARPGRPSTNRAAARKTDCRRDIWPVGQQADCCSSLDGCESLLELEREQHPWSELMVEQVVADADNRSTRWYYG